MAEATGILPQANILGSQPDLQSSTLGLDASATDQNLRAIRQVEKTWRLPTLPDGVRLDLASSGVAPNGISTFLRQIDTDVHGENPEDLPQAQPQPATSPLLRLQDTGVPFTPLVQNGFEQAANLISTLRNIPPAEVDDANAVQRWKLKAIDEGYMTAPESGVVDDSWSPELGQVQREMQFADYNDKLRGNRTGAMPAKNFLNTLAEWTSPSGLMRAAVNLDLFWDFGQISKEFSSWGDKWSKVGHSHGVLDFGKNLLDAMTGPLDDIAVPIINMGLLFSGIGAGTNFARLGMTGLRGAEAVEAFDAASSLYRIPDSIPGLSKITSRFFPALDTAETAGAAAKGLGEQSWLATRLQKGGTLANKAGDAMAAWRELPGVVGAKRAVQTGMRFGIAQKVESFLPSYKGSSLGDWQPAASVADRALGNAWTQNIGDLILAPYSVFEPGTFTQSAKSLAAAGFKFLGSTPGRAAVGATVGAYLSTTDGGSGVGGLVKDAAIGSAVGAALPGAGRLLDATGLTHIPGIGFTGRFLKGLSWTPLGNDQRMTSLFYEGMKRALPEEEFGTFQQAVSKDGFLKAFADHHGLDQESASGAMYFVGLSAAIDHTSALQAGADVTSEGWRQRYLIARNKLTSQIRTFDENTTREDVIHSIVKNEGLTYRKYKRRFDQLNGIVDDATLGETIAGHNQQASLVLRQLMSPENLPMAGEGMTKYIANAMHTFGDWNKYQPSTHQLGSFISDGVLNDIEFMAPRAFDATGKAAGRKIPILEHLEEYTPPMDEGMIQDWSTHMHDQLFIEGGGTVEQFRKRGGYYNPLAREVDPTRSRVTLAKLETATKQEMLQKADEIGQTFKAIEDWGRVGRFSRKLEPGALDISKLHEMTPQQVTEIVKAIGKKGTDDAASLRRLHRFVTSRGVTADEAFSSSISQIADGIGTDPAWSERFGLPSRITDKDNNILSGMELLKARKKQILAKARTTAAELDGKGLVTKLRDAGKVAEADDFEQYLGHIEDQGYKIVHGADFLMPDDLLNRSGVFNDLGARHLNAMTLGNFFSRRPPEELAANVGRVRAASISRELGASVDSDVVKRANNDLGQILDEELRRNSVMTDDLAHQGIMSRMATSIRNSDIPSSIQSLGLGKNMKRVTTRLQEFGWSPEEAMSIWRGVKKGRFAEFSDLGLYAIEAKLRARNQLVDGLQVLAGTTEGSKLKQVATGAAIGAVAGAVTAQQTGGDTLTDAALGAAGGGLARPLTAAAAAPLVRAMDTKAWSRYGYLADNLAGIRDKLRFALSPFFDISRYTEAYQLTNTGAPKRLEDGSRIALPLSQSPKALKKSFAKGLEEGGLTAAEAKLGGQQQFQRVVDQFRAASGGRFDPNALESTGRWFNEVGIAGFNPTNWMASSFHHLQEAGLSPEAAYHSVKDMYTYGTSGRSAAEQSVNFLFFPFSFQKKVLTHGIQWLSDDMSRSVYLHDAMKAYEMLDKRYDLGEWSKDHLPALQQLQQLNAFAFGLSPGKLGGINAPYLNLLLGNPLDQNAKNRGLVFNLFMPHGVDAAGPGALDTIKAAVTKTIPALNDINYMIEDMKDQGHVLFDPSHMTRANQVRDAYTEWNDYKTGVEQALKRNGSSLSDMQSQPGYAPLLKQYELKKLELEKRFPAWQESKAQSAEKTARLGMERDMRLKTAEFDPANATPADVAFAKFDEQINGLKQQNAFYGMKDWTDAPPSQFTQIKAFARQLTQQVPAFGPIYKKFYQSDFGSLTSKVS